MAFRLSPFINIGGCQFTEFNMQSETETSVLKQFHCTSLRFESGTASRQSPSIDSLRYTSHSTPPEITLCNGMMTDCDSQSYGKSNQDRCHSAVYSTLLEHQMFRSFPLHLSRFTPIHSYEVDIGRSSEAMADEQFQSDDEARSLSFSSTSSEPYGVNCEGWSGESGGTSMEQSSARNNSPELYGVNCSGWNTSGSASSGKYFPNARSSR